MKKDVSRIYEKVSSSLKLQRLWKRVQVVGCMTVVTAKGGVGGGRVYIGL